MAVRSLLLLVVLVAAVAALRAGPAQAKKAFAKKEGVDCSKCHMNPKGGGPRNLVGSFYQVKKHLPGDDTPQDEIVRVVDEWMDGLMAVPPTVTWRRTPLAELDVEPAPAYEPAAPHDVLRRASLDLRGTVPTPDEVDAVVGGRVTVDAMIDRYVASLEFGDVFRLYHMDLVRPRTGDYNQPPAYTKLEQDGGAWKSSRLPDDDCGDPVKVSPYWDREQQVPVCRKTADEATVATTKSGKTVRCDSTEGQTSGACGCGPHLVFCWRDGDGKLAIASMREEAARIAMEVVLNDRPYTDVLTADWTMNDGRLETFYAKLAGRLADVADPDWKRPWRKVDRDAKHSGILSTPEFNNFFYNGRRWAQRAFEVFFCHETTPDFDLLDDLDIAGGQTAVPYRDQPDLPPSITVTEGRACAACHVQLDSLSRVRDRWDVWGQHHERDAREKVIPETVVFQGREVTGLDGFGRALADSEVFHDCVVSQVWTHMVGHRFQPHETTTRRALVEKFRGSGFRFKDLVKEVARTPEYRAKTTLKLMTRELYKGSFKRVVGSAWTFKGGESGFDRFYDKVGGMDYRKIEFRDRRPGIGHALVQYKAAAESCSGAVDSDLGGGEARRVLRAAPLDLKKSPTDAELERVIEDLHLRAYARPASAVGPDDRAIARAVFRDVEKDGGTVEGWKALCTTLLAAADFAVY